MPSVTWVPCAPGDFWLCESSGTEVDIRVGIDLKIRRYVFSSKELRLESLVMPPSIDTTTAACRYAVAQCYATVLEQQLELEQLRTGEAPLGVIQSIDE